MSDRYKGQVNEVINRNNFINIALNQGFNVYLPIYDRGVDFFLYRETDGVLHKVQLKSRWTIDKKYTEKDISIAFPIEDQWYLMPHDEMVTLEKNYSSETRSWKEKGAYSRYKPRRELINAVRQFKFPPTD